MIRHRIILRHKSGLAAIVMAIFLCSTALAVDPHAYVVNSSGESLSKINLNSGMVTNNFVTLGSDIFSYANQIVIRDTLAYVIASGTDELQIINLNTEQTVDFINTGELSNPYWMAFYDSRYVYVTLLLNDQIARIDLTDKSIIYINTGVAPAGIVIYDNKLFVVCSNYDFVNFEAHPSDVYVYDITTGALITTVPVGVNAQYAAVDSEGRIHVAITGDYFAIFGSVYIIDGDDYTVVDDFAIGGSPGQISIGPDNIAYIAAAGYTFSGYVFSYNAMSGQVYHDSSNPIEVDLNCIAVGPYQDSTLFTGSFTDYISVIDSAGNYLEHYAVGDGPVHLDFNYLPGDVNGDFEINVLDIVYYVNYKFKNGPDIPYPRWRANVNADFYYNILDIIYLVNYKFKSGHRPKVGPTWFEPFKGN